MCARFLRATNSIFNFINVSSHNDDALIIYRPASTFLFRAYTVRNVSSTHLMMKKCFESILSYLMLLLESCKQTAI